MDEEVKHTKYNEPRQMFLDTLIEFYTKLGDKNFWGLTRFQRENTLQALMQDYFRTSHGEHLKDDYIALQAAIQEYHTRSAMVEIKKTNGG
jgi:DNA-binding Lrp family transcriptional regulator